MARGRWAAACRAAASGASTAARARAYVPKGTRERLAVRLLVREELLHEPPRGSIAQHVSPTRSALVMDSSVLPTVGHRGSSTPDDKSYSACSDPVGMEELLQTSAAFISRSAS